MATAALVRGEDASLQPGWPASASKVSILLQELEKVATGVTRCLVGFLAPHLIVGDLHVGAELVVLEGPRVVAQLRVDSLLP
jgi:hypothetical protein